LRAVARRKSGRLPYVALFHTDTSAPAPVGGFLVGTYWGPRAFYIFTETLRHCAKPSVQEPWHQPGLTVACFRVIVGGRGPALAAESKLSSVSALGFFDQNLSVGSWS
jgi:hypothetical protein